MGSLLLVRQVADEGWRHGSGRAEHGSSGRWDVEGSMAEATEVLGLPMATR